MQSDELLKAPSLADQFPLEFRNGFRIATLGFWCLSCKTAIPLAEVHGQSGRLLERVVDITAAAACQCGEINRYRIRLHDDATCTYVKNGVWVKESAINHSRLGFFDRLRIELLFLGIRWKCFWLARGLKILHRDFRNKHGLNQDI